MARFSCLSLLKQPIDQERDPRTYAEGKALAEFADWIQLSAMREITCKCERSLSTFVLRGLGDNKGVKGVDFSSDAGWRQGRSGLYRETGEGGGALSPPPRR